MILYKVTAVSILLYKVKLGLNSITILIHIEQRNVVLKRQSTLNRKSKEKKLILLMVNRRTDDYKERF